jgi:hypothetical protein
MTPEDRAWAIVRRAYEQRTPAPRRAAPRLIAAGVAVTACAALVASFSPSGRAVFHRVREAVGVEHAAPALFSLPAPGRLLVVARGSGAWLVQPDGFLQRLGSYEDADWSPHGLYVVATEENALVALAPDGTVRWRLDRRSPAFPRWEGTTTDTRIAYFAAGGLRVVAGDGTGDRLLDARSARVAPAWDPARGHTVAYAVGRSVVVRNADDGRLVWRMPLTAPPRALSWSSDGTLLAVVTARGVAVLDGGGRLHRTVSLLGGRLTQAVFRPATHLLAVVVASRGRSEVRVVDVDRPGRSRLVFAGPGAFGDIAWSARGGWLLVDWPNADQWVFVRGRSVHAVANVAEQFGGGDTPAGRLEIAGRWCCTGG